MDNIYLKQLADKSLKAAKPNDVNAPLSFLEWRESSPAVPEENSSYHYNQYVLDWFSTNKNKPVAQKLLLRQKYLFLLQQLQTFFTEEEKNTWYNQINFADEKELYTAIPYFAKKLRDIAVYYLSLRKQLKNTKLKYNTVGTKKGLEHEIYSYILNVLSPDNPEHSPQFLTLFPMFSALQQSLVVTVDELYDDNQYFDRSNTAPLSSYVNVLDAATASFFQTKGIVLSSDEWIFETFNLPVTRDLNTLVNRLTGNVFETSDINTYGSFIQNYLSENKYTLTYVNSPTLYTVNNIPLSQGNNRFYYPYGLVDTTLTIKGQTIPIALSSVSLSGAASGTTLEESDSIFVKYGDTIKGAWYRYIDYDVTTDEMDAYIEHNSTTSFIYPFPGYGLSADDLLWTGAGLTSDQEYPFLSKENKAAIQKQYWSSPLSSNSCFDIFLNNSTSVSAGANASRDFKKADKMYFRDRNMVYDTTLPVRELSGAWLYKFTKTALPISLTQPNVLLWPYDILDTTLAELPEHIQNLNYKNVCSPVSINELDTSYFVAASSIDLADRIYKLRYFKDNEQTDALECVWLSGNADKSQTHSFIKQDGLSMSIAAGTITKFIWTGADYTPLSSVFTSVSHQADCPFVTNVPSVSAYEWQKCTCKQVYYSPFGHTGTYFTDSNSLADFVVEDTSTDLSKFNISTWTDLSGNAVNDSYSFAWYNTVNKDTWGHGRWTSRTLLLENVVPDNPEDQTYDVLVPDPKTLRLMYGKSYYYGRVNSPNNGSNFPLYNVLNKFNTSRTKWIQARPNNNSSGWVSNDTPANFTINAGEVLKVVRQNQTTSYFLSSYNVPNSSSNQGSIWWSYDSVAISDNPLLNSTTISWPSITTQLSGVSGLYYGEYPPVDLASLFSSNRSPGNTYTSVASGRPSILCWNITNVQTSATVSFYNTPVVTFTPNTTGTFYVDVTARDYFGAYYFLYGNSSPNRGSITKYLSTPTYPTTGTYVSDSVFVVPDGVSAVNITGVGGGGGGGSATQKAAAGGGGGGSGGLCTSSISVKPGDQIVMSIGKGGSGSKSTNPLMISNGSPGGSTVVTLVSSNGIKTQLFVAEGGLGGGGTYCPHKGGLKPPPYKHPNTRPGPGGQGGNGTIKGNNGSKGRIVPTQYGTFGPGGPGGYSLFKGAGAGGKGADLAGDISPGPSGGESFPEGEVVPGTWNGDAGKGGLVEIVYNVPPTYAPVPLSGTVIADLTAIPPYTKQIEPIPFYTPSGGFLIEQPLVGWSYGFNGIQASPYDNNKGASPYWATIYKDKEPSTHSKGTYTWGYPNEWIDGYIPHHIPRISPLKLQYGTILEYERNGTSFWWNQPLTFQAVNGTSQWSILDFGTNISNLSSIFETENVKALTAFATTSASDIILTNNIDGTPVTILYYALNSFVWTVSTFATQNITAPSPALYFQSQLPYSNLSNRFFPTIATVPTLEYLYSKDDVGGYFVPQNLGASQFINKDYTAFAPISTSNGLGAQYIVEDTNIHIGGRGLSKQDQTTIYDWTENNLWMKESSTTGELAGYIKKNLTKTLQTFIPYQSNTVDGTLGLVTPSSRTSPWGGPLQDQWTDSANETKSFTGVRNVSDWSSSQVLKQNGKVLNNWVTDVYGNQYGLFKPIGGASIADKSNQYGEIWIRTNKQNVRPATVALSGLFSLMPNNLYLELQQSVLSIDCFFNVLMIHTPSIVIYAKLEYDYDTDEITTAFDNIRGYFGFPQTDQFNVSYQNSFLQYLGEILTFNPLKI